MFCQDCGREQRSEHAIFCDQCGSSNMGTRPTGTTVRLGAESLGQRGHWVTVGVHRINLDRVARIEYFPYMSKRCVVTFTRVEHYPPDGNREEDDLELHGEACAALLKYVDAIGTVLLEHTT